MVSTDYRLGFLWLPWRTENTGMKFLSDSFRIWSFSTGDKGKGQQCSFGRISVWDAANHMLFLDMCAGRKLHHLRLACWYICVNGCSNHMFHSTKSFLQSAPNHIPTRIHTCESTAQRFKKPQFHPWVNQKPPTLHTFQTFPSHPVTSPNFSGQTSGFHVGFHDGPYVCQPSSHWFPHGLQPMEKPNWDPLTPSCFTFIQANNLRAKSSGKHPKYTNVPRSTSLR